MQPFRPESLVAPRASQKAERHDDESAKFAVVGEAAPFTTAHRQILIAGMSLTLRHCASLGCVTSFRTAGWNGLLGHFDIVTPAY
jgi:hypothetical protein